MAISSLLLAIILHFYINKKNRDVTAAVPGNAKLLPVYLGQLLDGVDVGLVGDLPLHFFDVVEVDSRRRGGKARGRLVGNGGKRGEGRHGSQGTHVGQGSRHGSCRHACHSGAHGEV